MSYVVAVVRQLDCLKDIFGRVNILPLGSGALAGNPFNIDRAFLAKELQFGDASLNSLDATGGRDFVGKCLFITLIYFSLLETLKLQNILHIDKSAGVVVCFYSSCE